MKRQVYKVFIILLFTSVINLIPFQVHAGINSVENGFKEEQRETNGMEGEFNDEINTVEEEGNTDSSPSLAWTLVKMVFSLFFVLALIYFLLRFINKRNRMFSRVKTLENLGGLSLGTNRSIQIVRIANRYYVVGVGDNVDLLTEITDEDTIAEINQNQYDLQNQGFIPSLKKTNVENKSTIQFQQLFSNELKGMKNGRQTMINRYKDRKENQDE
ncbi:flagellar biosynthetic protein FliO [Bacillaceae bacterium S4-13-58]